MSNHLAVATVTATLHNVLLNAASVVPGTTVTTKRPDGGPAPGPAINAFLYQVTPNAAYRNADLPTRRAAGQLVRKPQAALMLHYLLSFMGDDTRFEAQRLLGAAVRELHAQPALRPKDIISTIGNPPFDAVLANSDLDKQVDLVRLVPLNLSLDELSKMWSVFFQIPYALSVAYQASVVLIETDDTPRAALPVKTRNVYTLPLRQPTIDRVTSASGEDLPIFSNSTLLIRGRDLRATAVQVLIGGADQPTKTVNDTAVTVGVPPGLAAGLHAVQVLHKTAMGADDPKKPGHPGFESNVSSFVLQPRVKTISKASAPPAPGSPAGPALKVTLDLKVKSTQRASLLVNSASALKPYAGSFASVRLKTDAATLTFPIPGVPAGKHFVTVQVDGAASPVDLEPGSPTFGPTVTLP